MSLTGVYKGIQRYLKLKKSFESNLKMLVHLRLSCLDVSHELQEYNQM